MSVVPRHLLKSSSHSCNCVILLCPSLNMSNQCYVVIIGPFAIDEQYVFALNYTRFAVLQTLD